MMNRKQPSFQASTLRWTRAFRLPVCFFGTAVLVAATGLWFGGGADSSAPAKLSQPSVVEAAAPEGPPSGPPASPVIESYKLPPAAGDGAAPVGAELVDAAPSKPTFFIYHSHNRESWLPELSGVTKPHLAFDAEHNITLLGARLAERFEAFGFDAAHSKADYNALHQHDYPHYDYYAYSRTTAKEALAVHRDKLFLFDLHRDSQGRELTTVEHEGQSYAQVYFVVGTAHDDWEMNEAYAERIHERLNETIPNLSRGIYLKSRKEGDGVYNQDLSPTSALVEIGGVENTLEESYRTIDVLAKVVRDLVLEDRDAARI